MAAVEPTDQKKKALNTALSQHQEGLREGAIMRWASMGQKVQLDAISTGAMNLDVAIGIGGIPWGRICEIFGPESSGKTTLCLHVIANAQKLGESRPSWMRTRAGHPVCPKLGVDVDNLLVSQPDTGEQALKIAEVLSGATRWMWWWWTRWRPWCPVQRARGDGDSHVGLQARL